MPQSRYFIQVVDAERETFLYEYDSRRDAKRAYHAVAISDSIYAKMLLKYDVEGKWICIEEAYGKHMDVSTVTSLHLTKVDRL